MTKSASVFMLKPPKGKMWRIPVESRLKITFCENRLEKVARDLEQSARMFRYASYFFIVAGAVTVIRWVGKHLGLEVP